MRNKVLFLAFILSSWTSFGQIVINEYSAANYNGSTDNYGEFEDWMELYNPTAAAIDLNGYYLSDKSDNLTKFQINAPINIAANDHLIVYASGRSEVNANNIHTSFKITQTKGNEWWILTDPDGITVVDSIFVRPALVNQSRGRLGDGDANWGVYDNPSPDGNNTGGYTDYAAIPVFSEAPGYHPAAINLSISSTEATDEIYYTLDGSHPDDTDNLYTGPINITNTTVVKAVCYSTDPAVHRSFIEYGTYFINTQHTVPIISISGGQVDDLLDGNGWLEPWGAFEYYRNGVLADKARGEFNEHGNDSWAYDQRGFDYITRDQFGYNHAVQDEIFRTKDRGKFKRLIVKAAANDNYNASWGGAHIRDSYVQSLSQVADLRMDERSYEPCILYLNGEYWGVYDIREKVSDLDFTEYYYDQGRGDVQYLKTWGGTWQQYGAPQAMTDWNDLVDFILGNDMTDPTNYAYVKSVYNTGSLIDYFILNTYVVAADWLNWNTSWWRGLNPDGDKKKWRYTLWDMDNTFGHGTNYTGIPSQDSDADPCNPESLGDPGGQGHVPIWNTLLQNEEFFADYINRFADLSNSYFSCDFMLNHLDSLIGIIDPEMPQQINTWGGSYNGWQNNVQEMRDFIEERCAYVNSGIVDCYDVEGPYNVTILIEGEGSVELSSIEITTDMIPWTGEYFGGVNFPLEANGEGFDFWEIISDDNYIFDPAVDTLALNLLGDVTIIAHFSTESITYFVDPPGAGTIFVDGTELTNFPAIDGFTNNPNFTITANPTQQWQFDYWESIHNNILPNSNSETANFTANTTDSITLHLKAANKIVYQIEPPIAGNMLIDGAPMLGSPYTTWYPDNENVVLESTPNMFWELDYWAANNHNLNPNNTTEIVNFSVLSDDTITLYYKPIEYPITFTTNPLNSGELLLNGTTISEFPAVVDLTFEDDMDMEVIENKYWKFKQWSSSLHPLNIYSLFNNVDVVGSDTIVLHFDEIIFHDIEVSVNPPSGGFVSIDNIEPPYLPFRESYAENTYIQLNATEAEGFKFTHWSTNTLSPMPGIETPFISVAVTESDQIVANFKEVMDLFIPNAFSPNGDHANNTFDVTLHGTNEFDYEITIYDRWGKKLYHSTDINESWDGTHPKTGKIVPMGVYSYIARLTSVSTNLTINRSGTVAIIR